MAHTLLLLIFLCIDLAIGINLLCTSKDCRKTACPVSCSCLGSLVDCSRRNFNEAPKDVPVWVQILDLQSNNISFVKDDDLVGLTNLTELDLSNNQLKYLNSSLLQHLTALQRLIIHKNNLLQFPNISHQSLAFISLQYNDIQHLTELALSRLPKLHTLDLSFNNISELLDDAFGYSASLRHLSLSHNKISNIDKDVFANLTVLESLKLNKNRLLSIPKDLFRHLGHLRHLELNANTLKHIEGLVFQSLSSLMVLKLRHSGISELLDGAFYGLNNIKKLQLDYNSISKITKGSLYGLNSLQWLYLNNNNISLIEDDAWDSCKRLMELDLSHNKLQFITLKSFDKLYSLKRLVLSDNLLTYIEEGAFRSLSAVQYLELKNNELSWTIEDTGQIFTGLDRLKFLGLSSNNIKAVVRRAFAGLPRLRTLNLSNNELTTIEEKSFNDLSHLQELLINSSSLICDLGLSWIVQSFDFQIHAKCGFPKSLEGQSVFDVPPKEFACNSPKPIIIKPPLTKITLKGENVTLECQAKSTGIADVKYLWKKDGKLLQGKLWNRSEDTKMANFTLHTSWLFIQNIKDEDEGHYQCIVVNKFGAAFSSKAHITVHVYPVFTKTPVDVAIKSGSTARLECGAKGQPQPDITWRKNGGGEDFPAARERRMHVMLPTDDLFFIVNAKASDSGVYSCTAKNVAGVITANATLTVLETPTFARKMENKEVMSGETAVLECMAAGSPKPNLEWFKDDVPLGPSERHFFTGSNQLLVIVPSIASDSGIYTCKMSNVLGSEQGSSHLTILPAQSGGNSIDDSNMTGIIVIAVVVCVVGTSIVWVIVIHRTRKTRDDFIASNSNATATTDMPPFNQYRSVYPKDVKQSVANIYADSHSDHSKDSGTGDSAQPSSDDLLLEDDQGLLLEMHSSSPLAAARMNSLLVLPDNMSRVICETYASSNSSVSKERVPLLSSFCTSRSPPWRSHRKSIAEFRLSETDSHPHSCSDKKWPCILVQRSLSVDQVNSSDSVAHQRGSSEPLEDSIRTCGESDGLERDCGFSTFPRSITQASVSNWSTESSRLHKLPKDIPNDSGSFSIASEDVHIHVNPMKCLQNVISTDSPNSQTSRSHTLATLEHKT